MIFWFTLADNVTSIRNHSYYLPLQGWRIRGKGGQGTMTPQV